MWSLRKYRGQGVGVSAQVGDYSGTLDRVSWSGLELVDASVRVNGQDVALKGRVFVPASQVVHVQVAT